MSRLNLKLLQAIEEQRKITSLELEGDLELPEGYTEDDFWMLLSDALSQNNSITEIILSEVPGTTAQKLIEIINQVVAENTTKIKDLTLKDNSLEEIQLLLPSLLTFKSHGYDFAVNIISPTIVFSYDDNSELSSELNFGLIDLIQNQITTTLEISNGPTSDLDLQQNDQELVKKLQSAFHNNSYLRKVILSNLTVTGFTTLLQLIIQQFENTNCKSNIRKIALYSQSLKLLDPLLPLLIQFNKLGSNFSVSLSVLAEASQNELEDDIEPPFKKRKTNNTSDTKFFIKENTKATSPLKENVINVSGHGNNCGLYALSLAVALACKGVTEDHLTNIPEFVKNITENDVLPGSKKVAIFGQVLRGYLYTALEEDMFYKHLRQQTFINILFTNVAATDATSFSASNETYIRELQDAAELLQAMLFSVEEIAPFNLNSEPQEIEAFILQLKTLFLLDSPATEISQYLPLNAELSDIIKFVTTFATAWDHITKSDASDEKRQEVRDAISQHIYQVLSANLQQFEENSAEFLFHFKIFLKLFELSDLGHKNDTLLNLKLLYCYYRVNRDWEDCYQRYLVHLRDKGPMLTADELNSLANAWKVNLTIEFPNKVSYQSNSNYPLSVVLCNPSQMHWKVRLPEVMATEMYLPDELKLL